jgi:hypothetical protein
MAPVVNGSGNCGAPVIAEGMTHGREGNYAPLL